MMIIVHASLSSCSEADEHEATCLKMSWTDPALKSCRACIGGGDKPTHAKPSREPIFVPESLWSFDTHKDDGLRSSFGSGL